MLDRVSPQVIVKSANRVDSSVVITWDSRATNLLGFRVVYRLFGDRSFKQGPPLDASEREFKIKNVPAQVGVSGDHSYFKKQHSISSLHCTSFKIFIYRAHVFLLLFLIAMGVYLYI